MTGLLRIPARPLWLMVTVTVAVCLISPYDLLFGDPGDPPVRNPALVIAIGAALVTLQLRHSLAAARGERPRWWPWTLAALAVFAVVPVFWYTWKSLPVTSLLIASALMLLRPPRLGLAVALLTGLGTQVFIGAFGLIHHWTVADMVFAACFWVLGVSMEAALVYGAARMARGASELAAARIELAELAIAQERMRISRDLHDLLGQSLSAVSLRGDLALRLVARDPEAARAEIATLTATARAALHDVLGATGDRAGPDLGRETSGALALLSAAGIKATVAVDADGLPAAARTVFAWALREGVTNILRHSDARECSVTLTRPGAAARLEIINDGAPPVPGERRGTGLTGLAERSRALSGQLTAGPLPGGRFRLLIDFPEEPS